MLREDAERDLYATLIAARDETAPMLEQRDYRATLARLSQMRDAVDRFFDEVLVAVSADS